MKISHSKQRASERYQIENFKERLALDEVYNDRCIQIVEDYEKYSRTFLIRYFNKYIRVVTDFNVHCVKTVLPLKDDFELIDKLINKLSMVAA